MKSLKYTTVSMKLLRFGCEMALTGACAGVLFGEVLETLEVEAAEGSRYRSMSLGQGLWSHPVTLFASWAPGSEPLCHILLAPCSSWAYGGVS